MAAADAKEANAQEDMAKTSKNSLEKIAAADAQEVMRLERLLKVAEDAASKSADLAKERHAMWQEKNDSAARANALHQGKSKAATEAADVLAEAKAAVVAAKGNHRCLALIFGNNYADSDLQLNSCILDAETMAAAMHENGYIVRLERAADRETMMAALVDLKQSIRDGDEVYVYFSGHGVSIGGTTFLLPEKFKRHKQNAKKHFEENAVPMTEVTKHVCMTSNAKVVVVDACREVPSFHQKNSLLFKAPIDEDAIVTGMQQGSINVAKIAQTAFGSNLLVIYSCSDGGCSFDGGKKQMSLMTKHFVQLLRDPEVVPLHKIVSKVTENVVNESKTIFAKEAEAAGENQDDETWEGRQMTVEQSGVGWLNWEFVFRKVSPS